MPFIQILGFDIFNPTEVIPEYICDIGTKKGEKIDYVIMRDGEPILLLSVSIGKKKLMHIIRNFTDTTTYQKHVLVF